MRIILYTKRTINALKSAWQRWLDDFALKCCHHLFMDTVTWHVTLLLTNYWIIEAGKWYLLVLFLSALTAENNSTNHHYWCSHSIVKGDHHQRRRLLQQSVSTAAIRLRPSHSVLNAAAKVIMRKRKYDHITPGMRYELHWLPVPQRLEYKVCWFVYKWLHQMAPSYLVKICIAVDSVERCHHLWSAARVDLIVPRTKSKTYGPWSFAVAAPLVQNSLSIVDISSIQ